MNIIPPDGLLRSMSQRNCVAFLGAGISIGAGAPTWKGLLEQLIQFSLDKRWIDADDYDQLCDLVSRGEYDIAAETIWDRARDHRAELKRFLEDIFDSNLKGPTPAHHAIVRAPFRAVYTTNYDCLIEQAYFEVHGRLPWVVTWENLEDALGYDERGEFYVAKLHGCIRNSDSIILSKSHYIKVTNRPSFQVMMQALFIFRSSMFIGYSVSDDDINQLFEQLRIAFPDRGHTNYCLAKRGSRNPLELENLEKLYRIQFLQYDEHADIVPYIDKLAAAALPVSSSSANDLSIDPKLTDLIGAMHWVFERSICEGEAQVILLRARRGTDWARYAICCGRGVEVHSILPEVVTLAKRYNPDETIVLAESTVSEAQRKEADNLGASYQTIEDLALRAADLSLYADKIADEQGPMKLSHPYLQPAFKAEDREDDESLDEYVQRWLNDPQQRILWLLGDFGTGKTWFCRHFSQWLAGKKLDGNLPVPVLISLRDYSNTSVDLEEAVQAELARHGVVLANGRKTLDWLLKTGRLLLVFDGADEHPSARDEAQFLQVGRSKIIITCRTNYFESNQDTNRSVGETKVVHLVGFDNETVSQAIQTRFPDDWRTVEEKLSEWPDLREMARRPLFMNMLLQVADELTKTEDPTVASIYDEYLNSALSMRNDDKLAELLRAVLESLAFEGQMKSPRGIQFSFTDLAAVAESVRLRTKSNIDRNTIIHALRVGTVLIRNENDFYEYGHLSLQEYLAASYLARKGKGGNSIIRQNITNNDWREVCWLYSAVCRDATTVIEACLANCKKFPRLLFLAARSMNAARQWDHPLAERLGDALIDLFLGDYAQAYEFLQGIYESFSWMGPAGKVVLKRKMSSEDLQIRRRCILTWYESFDHDAFKAVLPYLDHDKEKDAHVRWHAAEVLAEVAQSPDLEDLAGYRNDKDYIVRGNVLWAYTRWEGANGNKGPLENDVLPGLEKIIKEGSQDEKAHASLLLCRCISSLNWQEGERAKYGNMLTVYLKDQDSKWRGYVSRALDDLGWSGAVPKLCEYLHKSDDSEIWLRYAVDAVDKLALPEHLACVSKVELRNDLPGLRSRLKAIEGRLSAASNAGP